MIAYSTTTNSVTLHHKANDYVDFKKEFTHHPKTMENNSFRENHEMRNAVGITWKSGV